MSSTEEDYQQAAEWADRDMTLNASSATALRGQAAAAFGSDLLADHPAAHIAGLRGLMP